MTIEIKRKGQEEQSSDPKITPLTTDTSTDSKLALLKFTAEVQSRIKDQITTDFTLAKLTSKDKEAITEMVSNAYLAKQTATLLARIGKKWTWNKEKKEWNRNYLTKEERQIIEKQGEIIFDNLLRRTYMTAILNRNVPENHMIRILAGLEETPEAIPIEEEPTTLLGKAKKAIKKKEDNNETPNFD